MKDGGSSQSPFCDQSVLSRPFFKEQLRNDKADTVGKSMRFSLPLEVRDVRQKPQLASFPRWKCTKPKVRGHSTLSLSLYQALAAAKRSLNRRRFSAARLLQHLAVDNTRWACRLINSMGPAKHISPKVHFLISWSEPVS